MRKTWKFAVALLIGAATVIAPAGPAAAFSTSGCKFTTGTLKWQNATTRDTYSSPAINAVNAWNSTSTQFNLNPVSSGANIRIADGNFGATWNGMTFPAIMLDTNQENPWNNSCGGGTWDTTVVLWWNRHYTDGYSLGLRSVYMQFLIGEALGLLPTDYATSCADANIMDKDVASWHQQCGLSKPVQDDIDGANFLY